MLYTIKTRHTLPQMNQHTLRINPALFCFFFYLFCWATPAQNHLEKNTVLSALPGKDSKLALSKCSVQPAVVSFKPQSIFNEAEQGILFLHRWANAIHIKTKVATLENESAFFLKKCHKSTADMAELERHLRTRKYLRDALVTSDQKLEKISVTTWDNWSLLPSLGFGREGGVNTYSFGIKERNLLGLGINAEIASYKNAQRSGYQIYSTIPLYQKLNTEIKLKFADNDDGQQKNLFLTKSFASFATEYAYTVGFNDYSRNDTIFQNGTKQHYFSHQAHYKTLNYAWLSFNDDNSLLRYRVGITQDEHTFTAPTQSQRMLLPTQELPLDRNFIYPWFGLEYIEKDFKKKTNIHLISQIEDFNQGWQLNATIGFGDRGENNSPWALWKMQVKKGFNMHNNAFLLIHMLIATDFYKHSENRVIASLHSEYFYRLNQHWGIYLRNINIASDNQYRDKPVSMGGNAGLRGFPLQYQHGDNTINLTAELRYYPQFNLFKLFDIAGVVFFDTGRAFGATKINNIESGWLNSSGIGARIYSPHSSVNHQVIHIDLAFPQSRHHTINSVEIRLQAKSTF